MTNLMQSEIFFFISSIGFIILGGIFTIILLRISRAIDSFLRILEKLEKDAGEIGEEAKEMIEEIHDSNTFRFLFGKKKKGKKK